MNIMNTFTGLQFDPLKMTVRDVSLKDIAHALSFLCRGGGQTLFFYSVAQHSLNCAREDVYKRQGSHSRPSSHS